MNVKVDILANCDYGVAIFFDQLKRNGAAHVARAACQFSTTRVVTCILLASIAFKKSIKKSVDLL